MIAYQATITISATPETIWGFLTDAPSYPSWDPSADRIEGTIAPGETIKAYSKLSPGRAFPAKVTEFIPGQKMTWSGGMPLGLFKGVRTFTLNSQEEKPVEFTLREEFSGLLLPLFSKTIPDLTKTFENFVAGLKRVAEAKSS